MKHTARDHRRGGGTRVFAVGQRVLGKFENSAEFFDGVIDSINRNGTFVVAVPVAMAHLSSPTKKLSVDGDWRHFIKKIPTPPPSSLPHLLSRTSVDTTSIDGTPPPPMREYGVCFITAGPITKLFAWGSGPNCFQALGSSPGLLQSPIF
jgi:hypothetical protein